MRKFEHSGIRASRLYIHQEFRSVLSIFRGCFLSLGLRMEEPKAEFLSNASWVEKEGREKLLDTEKDRGNDKLSNVRLFFESTFLPSVAVK